MIIAYQYLGKVVNGVESEHLESDQIVFQFLLRKGGGDGSYNKGGIHSLKKILSGKKKKSRFLRSLTYLQFK